MGAKESRRHSEHVAIEAALSVGEYVPGAQAVQEVEERVEDEYMPEGQEEHEEEEGVEVFLPGGQAVHDAAAGTEEYFPGVHFVQLELVGAPITLLAVPAEQGSHVSTVDAPYSGL